MLAWLGAALSEEPTTTSVSHASCEAYGMPFEKDSTYHGDQVCDRSRHNEFKQNLHRGKCWQEGFLVWSDQSH